jgi:hypothetical protein
LSCAGDLEKGGLKNVETGLAVAFRFRDADAGRGSILPSVSLARNFRVHLPLRVFRLSHRANSLGDLIRSPENSNYSLCKIANVYYKTPDSCYSGFREASILCISDASPSSA